MLRSLSLLLGCSCGCCKGVAYLAALQSLVEDVESVKLFVAVHNYNSNNTPNRIVQEVAVGNNGPDNNRRIISPASLR